MAQWLINDGAVINAADLLTARDVNCIIEVGGVLYRSTNATVATYVPINSAGSLVVGDSQTLTFGDGSDIVYTPDGTNVDVTGTGEMQYAVRMTTTDGVASGTAKRIGGISFVSTADSSTLTSLTAPTPFDVTYAIPANTLKAGSVLKIRAVCRSISVNGADTLQYTLRLNDGGGADVMVASTALNVGANNRVLLEGWLIARAAPGAAVATSSFFEASDLSIGARTAGPAAGAPIAMATNAAITVDVLCTHSASSASNQSVLESLIVEVI